MVKGHVIDKITGEEKFSLRGASRDKIEAMIDSDSDIIIYSDNFPVENTTINTLDLGKVQKVREELDRQEKISHIKSKLSLTNLTVSDVSNWVDSNVKSQKDILDVVKQLIILSLER